MSAQMTLWGSPKRISSPESEGGHTPSDSPDGLTTDLCGPAVVHVNRSAVQAKGEGLMTSDTSGPKCSYSSESAALQSALESRLIALLAGRGSPLYALTWKVLDMPWGGGVLPGASVGAPHTRDRIFWAATYARHKRGAGHRTASSLGELRPWRTFGALDLREILDRPFDPGTRFDRPRVLALSDGIPARVGRLRAYGNAIIPQVAAIFIRSVMDTLTPDPP